MAKATEITVDVNLTIPDATVIRCLKILEMWMDDNPDRNLVCDRVPYTDGFMPQFRHEFPLIDRELTKADAHGICRELGVKRPIMYDLVYSNNNCKGCVKGGMGYWNKIREDFPEVFADRAKMEREIGHSILHNENGMIFLDELDPNAGRMEEEIMDDCSIFCQLAIGG